MDIRGKCWQTLGTSSNPVCAPVLHCHAFQDPLDTPLLDVQNNVLALAGDVQQLRLHSRASLPCISRAIGRATHGCTEQRVSIRWARSATPIALPCFTAIHFKSNRTCHLRVYGTPCWQSLGAFKNRVCAPMLHCHTFEETSDKPSTDIPNNVLAFAGHVQQPSLRSRAPLP